MEQVFNPTQRFAELWTDLAARMAAAGVAADPNAGPTETARAARSSALQGLSQFADQYMRSPQFLETMKQSFDSMLNFREQANDLLTRLHHELQGVARQDVDSLLSGIHQLESRIVDRLEDISTRLEVLEKRAGASPAAKRKNGTQPRRQRRRG